MANAAMLLQLLTRTLLASALLWWELRNKSWRPSHPGRIGSTMILSLRGDLSPLPAEDRLLGGTWSRAGSERMADKNMCRQAWWTGRQIPDAHTHTMRRWRQMMSFACLRRIIF
jgi:hypothetical protein